MDDGGVPIGLDNLARFVAATVGGAGKVEQVNGGLAVASAVPVANGYVNAAFRTGQDGSDMGFLADVRSFFAEVGHPYVVWAPSTDSGLVGACSSAGGTPDSEDSPMMVIQRPIGTAVDLSVRALSSAEDRKIFGRMCEEGYEKPGLARFLDHHRSYDAAGSVWAIVSDGARDLGVACGYLHGTSGGIYYVATPACHRGRGAAAAATAWLVDHLMEDGADLVALQASVMGFPIYERLGFRTVANYQQFVFESPA